MPRGRSLHGIDLASAVAHFFEKPWRAAISLIFKHAEDPSSFWLAKSPPFGSSCLKGQSWPGTAMGCHGSRGNQAASLPAQASVAGTFHVEGAYSGLTTGQNVSGHVPRHVFSAPLHLIPFVVWRHPCQPESLSTTLDTVGTTRCASPRFGLPHDAACLYINFYGPQIIHTFSCLPRENNP